MKCQHLKAHEIIPPETAREEFIREEMRAGGWFRSGYCEMYYPQWLHDEIGDRFDRASAIIVKWGEKS